MQLTAITRQVSANINNCELTFHARRPINLAIAIAQHEAYQQGLARLGVEVISLPALNGLPDSVFVEDAAVITDEVAIICRMGAPSRRPETESLTATLRQYRPVKFIGEPATLDGGDVLRVGRHVFVGLSQRTNREGYLQLSELLRRYKYEVCPVAMRDCLHLKSGCSYVGDDTILVNRSWVDVEPFHRFRLVDVPDEEPGGANALLINDVVIIADSFPKTYALFESRGFDVRAIDLSELQKAEAGVTCCSLIFGERQTR